MKKSVFMEALKESVRSEDLSEGREYLRDRRPVYLCLPFEGDLDDYMEKIYRLFPTAEAKGRALIAPYLALLAFKGRKREEMLAHAKDAVRCVMDGCNEFWVTRDTLTGNVLDEIAMALAREMKIVYVDDAEEEETDDRC